MLLTVEGFVNIIVKFRAERILCTFVSCTKHPFEGHNIMHEDDFVDSNNLKSV